MIEQPASVSPTPPDDRPRIKRVAARRRPLWMVYGLAALLTLATLLVRLDLGFTEGDPPLLILFTFPIVVSAYVGGLGPGLLTTLLATLLSNYVLLPPQYAFSLTTRFTLFQSGGLLGAGIVISVLSEELHRARVQAEAGQRFQTLTLASIGDAVVTTNTHGQITFLNTQAERLTGWSSAEAIGQPLAMVVRLMNAHSRAPIDDAVAKVLRSGTLARLATSTVLIGRDGRETMIEESGAPITTADATAQGVVLVFRDVTQREQADVALRESQERLAGIVGAAMDAIISIDATQHIVIFNTAAERIFGCPAESAIGQPLDRFIPLQFRGIHAAHIRAFGETGVTSRSMHSPGTLTALRADGTEFPIEATIAQTVVAQQPLYTVIMRDISARIQADLALHASEQRYRQIVETAQEGIWQIDVANRTTFANARMAAILGCTVDEMLGAALFDFMDAEGQAIAAANLERRRQGIEEQHDFKFRRKGGGDVWVLISTNPVLDSAGNYAGALAMVTDITARKRDEQALRLSEARFATAFRASPIAMSITSLIDGRFIDINTSHERLFGYKRDELIGQSADGISIYADPNQRAEVVRSISAHGSLRETELTLRTKSGELREVLCSLEAIELNSEACILGSVFDITARKQAEAALRENEELLRAVTNTAQVGLVIVDQEHRYRYANPAYVAIFHLEMADIVGQRVADVLASVYVSQIRPHLERAFGGERVTSELVVPSTAADEQESHYAVTYEPGVYRSHRMIVVVVVDITERKRAERALQRHSDRLQHLRMIDQSILGGHSLSEIAQAAVVHIGHLIPSTHVALVLIDAATATLSLYALQLRGELQAVQDLHAPLQSMGEALAVLTQGQVYTIADLAALPDLSPALQAAQSGGERAYFSTPILAGDELIALLNIGSEQPGAFTAEHLAIAREAADQLSIAIQQARLREAVMRQAQDLEGRVAARTMELTAANKELEAFSYSISHDLRAPLRAIDGFTRILLDEYAAAFPEEAQQYFQIIRDNAQQMGRLVDDLLAFSRLSRQPLALRTVDSVAQVHQCIQELRPEQADRRLTLRIGDLPACQGDPALLKQVWFNLIANALKYTRRRDDAAIIIDCQADGAETVFFVKDNGVGFDMRYSDKLFGVFQRLHRAEDYEGTGVGLAIVQRIIQRHGGRVWAEAAPNQGATFFFTLGGEPS